MVSSHQFWHNFGFPLSQTHACSMGVRDGFAELSQLREVCAEVMCAQCLQKPAPSARELVKRNLALVAWSSGALCF